MLESKGIIKSKGNVSSSGNLDKDDAYAAIVQLYSFEQFSKNSLYFLGIFSFSKGIAPR